MRVALARGEADRARRALAREQARLRCEHAREWRGAAADEDPVLAAAIATEDDVVGELRLRLRARRAPRPLLRRPFALLERARGRHAHAQRIRVRAGSELGDEREGERVKRDLRAADALELARLRVCEQGRDRFWSAVGREAQPPLAVGPDHVEHELAGAPFVTAPAQDTVE